ncbi:MAG: hypothetical protein HUJ30_00700 [Gammaproteobacteria bacterium]|nr:hypothetical protein [Gammaproteobacteria bacterium]
MIESPVYIDTRPNTGGLFSSAASVEDYAAWLTQRCEESYRNDSGNQVCYGVAQKVNQLAYHSKKQIKSKDKPETYEVLCFGPYAAAAAHVLRQQGVHDSHIKVLS